MQSLEVADDVNEIPADRRVVQIVGYPLRTSAQQDLPALVDRGLLEPVPSESAAVAASRRSEASNSEDEQQMLMHPALATILLARTFPTWVGLCSMDGQRTDLRIFGLGDTEDAYRGVVVETVEHVATEQPTPDTYGEAEATVYCYRLASTAVAATLVLGYAPSS